MRDGMWSLKPLFINTFQSVEYIIESLKTLRKAYNGIINRDHRGHPQLLDLNAFENIRDLLTYYCLDIASWEWLKTKKIGENIELGKLEKKEFNLEKGCQHRCELPKRYGIPCWHWMYLAYSMDCQISISLFHL
jgi:hypothetical protein